MSDAKLERVLIIDDNSDYRKLIKTFISKFLPSVETIEYDPVVEGAPGDDFDWSDIDVLLLDYNLSIVGTTGLDILHKHHKKPDFPATIMLTGAGTEEIAIRALKTGIHEYQPKQSLTKGKLKESIIEAWEAKKSQRTKQQEVTNHKRSFSKEVFYETLENALARKDTERVLLVIQADNINKLEKMLGIIGRDNLINHIGKNSFEIFKSEASNPNITRISDSAIAIQIDYPGNHETLESNMQGLCNHLTKSTFKFSDVAYQYTVSIGLLKLDVVNKNANQLIQIATAAAKQASEIEGNSYYIWKETDAVSDSPEPGHINAPHTPNDAAEIKAKAEKERLQLELKATEEARNKLEAELKSTAEAKQKAEAELKAAAEAKARAEQEAREKAAAEVKAREEQEIKKKIESEANAIKEAKAKLEAELKAMAEAKAKAEAEMKAVKEAKAKLEAELKAMADTKDNNSNIAPASSTAPSPVAADNEEQPAAEVTETIDVPVPSIQEIESRVQKLIDEKRIIQTYQPVMAMFDDDSGINLYKTGLKAITEDEDDEINEKLSDISIFSISLQKIINEWTLRQIFLRITEIGIENSKNHFMVTVNEGWFSDISLFNWLQKILSQTKKYAPGASIILDVPIDIYKKHQKRAKPLIDTLHKSHDFRICLSNITTHDTIITDCQLTLSNMLMLPVNELHLLAEVLAPDNKKTSDDSKENVKQTLIQYLESNGIRVVTSGIEDSTLLTDAITNGTDYALGGFIGEVQNSLVEQGTVESFDLS